MNEGAALGLVLDQVSKDKNIDRHVLVETLEQAILTAAKKAFGMHREMEAKFNEETGRVDLFQIIVIVEKVTDETEGKEITLEDANRFNLKAEVGDELLFQIFYDEKDQAKAEEQDAKYGDAARAQPRVQGLRPHRRADRQAGHPAARARGRARERLQRVQGPQGRAHLGHRAALRARQHHRRPRRRRGGAAGARAGAARVVPRGRPHRRLRPRHRQERARAADHPVAHAQGPAREAVRAWRSRRSTRRSSASRPRPARPGARSKIAVVVARPRRRSGRRLRRHEGLARPGGRAGAARREDRHRPVRRRSGALRVQRDRAGRGGARHHRRREPHAWSWSSPTTSCRWRSARRARTCASRRS